MPKKRAPFKQVRKLAKKHAKKHIGKVGDGPGILKEPTKNRKVARKGS